MTNTKSLVFLSAVKKQQVSTAAGAIESAKKRLAKSRERLDACTAEVIMNIIIALPCHYLHDLAV